MKIIFGGDAEHELYINGLVDDCLKFGYNMQVYDFDGSLRHAKPFPMDFTNLPKDGNYIAKIQMKPLMILDALYNSEPDELIVYLDSDTIIQKDISEIERIEFDVGLTYHPKDFYKNHPTEKHVDKVGLLNAGVIFIRNTENAKYFIRKWLVSMINDCKIGSDQEGLHYTVKKAGLLEPNKDVVWDGIKIHSFESKLYNCSNTRFKVSTVDTAFISHYPGFLKDKLKEKRNV